MPNTILVEYDHIDLLASLPNGANLLDPLEIHNMGMSLPAIAAYRHSNLCKGSLVFPAFSAFYLDN
jgi:hypothetical protein